MKLRNLILTAPLVLAGIPANAADNVYVCQACGAGTYSDGTFSTCKPCEDGKWAPAASSGCTKCTSTSVKSCSKTDGTITGCNAGYGYKTISGTKVCQGCTSGTYSTGDQNDCSTCTSSAVKTCSSTTGKATSCNAGYGYDSSAQTCSACSGATYSTGGTNSCGSCGEGVATCNATNGNATSCETGWQLVDGHCYNCETNGYFGYKDGECACDFGVELAGMGPVEKQGWHDTKKNMNFNNNTASKVKSMAEACYNQAACEVKYYTAGDKLNVGAACGKKTSGWK